MYNYKKAARNSESMLYSTIINKMFEYEYGSTFII